MATISIADSDARVQYTQAVTANSTTLTIDFPFFSLDDINVIVTSAAGSDTVLTRGTGTGTFAVNGTAIDDGFSGGNITLGDTYSNAATKFTIFRDIPVTRTTDFPTSGPFNITALNTELDKLFAIEQELETKIGRTMKLADSDSAATLSLPNLDTRKGTTLAFNTTTGLPEAGPKIGDVSTIAAITSDIGLLADIQDGTSATNAITTVSGISSNVTTVANISSNVSSVAGNASNINAVAADASDIGAVASSISNVDTVANIASNVSTVAGISSNVTAVANDASDIGTVASNISAINTNATNISAIQGAAANASTATTKASEAAASAATASTQASNSATSASTSTTQATNSANSASASANSATASANSATAAASSATAAAASQTAAAASAASAATAFDNFDDTYLGSKTSNPSQDNDGNALVSGALYFNSSANEMRVYDGANWIAATSAGNVSLILYEYNATANQTTFSGSDTNSATLSYTVDNLQVVVNGIVLDPSDFTATNGTSVVFASGAAAGDVVNIYAFKSFTTADMVSKSAGGTFAGAVNFGAGATVTGNLTADGLRLGDSDYAAFGDGQDLQIQHNGNNSFITDAGTGDLYIRGNNSLFVQNLDGSENKAQFITDGAVNLMHDGTTRISTSSTGVDVVGVVKANGHTSSASSVLEGSGNGDSVALQLKVKANNGSSSTQGLYGNAGSTSADNTITVGNSGTSGVTVNASGQVGVNKTGPQAKLHVIGDATDLNNSDNVMIIEGGDAGGNRGIHIGQIGNGSQARMFLQGFHSQAISNYWDLCFNPNGGNVMLGTNEPTLFNAEGTDAKLTVAGSDTSTTTIGNGGAAINIVQTDGTAGNTAGLHFSRKDTDGTPNYSGAAIVAQFTDTQATGQYPKARLVFNTSTNANAAPSEKMRLETNGSLRLGTASDEGFNNGQGTIIMKCTGGDALNINHTVNGSHVVNIKQSGPNTANFFFFFKNGNQVGRIQCSTTATSYDSLSDVRTKENIENMTDAIGRVKQLKPRRFNFIANPDETVDGFLAHEVTSVCPQAVSGTPDDVDDNGDPVYQTMDVAKLVPLLTGALQEALAKIETLETKVAALEAGS